VGRFVPRTAGRDVISGRGGNDLLFGDNTNFAGTRTFGSVGGDDDLDGGDDVDTLRAGPATTSLTAAPTLLTSATVKQGPTPPSVARSSGEFRSRILSLMINVLLRVRGRPDQPDGEV
jgi:hypothetical protein